MYPITEDQRKLLTPPSDSEENRGARLILPYRCAEPSPQGQRSRLAENLQIAATQAAFVQASEELCTVANFELRALQAHKPVQMRHLDHAVGTRLYRNILLIQKDNGSLRSELSVGGAPLPLGACLLEKLPPEVIAFEDRFGNDNPRSIALRNSRIAQARLYSRNEIEYVPCFAMTFAALTRRYIWRRIDESVVADRCRMPFIDAKLPPAMPMVTPQVATQNVDEGPAASDSSGDAELQGMVQAESTSSSSGGIWDITIQDENTISSMLPIDDDASDTDMATIVNRH